jgi:predicted protein tyrosine phosphatase
MNIKVSNYRSAFDYVYNHSGYIKNKEFAIISIQEYPEDIMGMQYKAGGHCKAALNLWFSDVNSEKSEDKERYIKKITEEDARKIKDFIDAIKRMGVNDLIVHCHAGVSRSAAVAAAISRAETGDDSEFFNSQYVPNMTVYYTVLKAFGFDNTPIMLVDNKTT